jgi:hypothetical protein
VRISRAGIIVQQSTFASQQVYQPPANTYSQDHDSVERTLLQHHNATKKQPTPDA